MRQHHELKTETKFYQAVESGQKSFELRKNDRDFKLYDMVTLKESVNGIETGRKIGPFEIPFILYGGEFWLPNDLCIFSLKEGV